MGENVKYITKSNNSENYVVNYDSLTTDLTLSEPIIFCETFLT